RRTRLVLLLRGQLARDAPVLLCGRACPGHFFVISPTHRVGGGLTNKFRFGGHILATLARKPYFPGNPSTRRGPRCFAPPAYRKHCRCLPWWACSHCPRVPWRLPRPRSRPIRGRTAPSGSSRAPRRKAPSPSTPPPPLTTWRR